MFKLIGNRPVPIACRFVTDPKHRAFWQEELDQIKNNSAKGSINVNMRRIRGLVQRYESERDV